MKLEEWLEIDKYEPIPTGVGTIAVSRHLPMTYKIPIRLYGTEYEAGIFFMPLVKTPKEETPVGMGAKKTVHSLTLAMHPTRGILNVAAISGGPEMDHRRFLAKTHDDLLKTCDVLEEWVREEAEPRDHHPVRSAESLPIGPAIIRSGHATTIDPAEVGINPAVVIDCEWQHVPDRLGEVMDCHSAGLEDAPDFLARNTATLIKNMRAEYMDHASAITGDDAAIAQLFEGDAAGRARFARSA